MHHFIHHFVVTDDGTFVNPRVCGKRASFAPNVRRHDRLRIIFRTGCGPSPQDLCYNATRVRARVDLCRSGDFTSLMCVKPLVLRGFPSSRRARHLAERLRSTHFPAVVATHRGMRNVRNIDLFRAPHLRRRRYPIPLASRRLRVILPSRIRSRRGIYFPFS
jgi:hypothetical protein